MATLSNVELDALAHSLACENAMVSIECNCVDVSDEAGAAGWFDIGQANEAYDDIERHVLYLETRGLIQRDETHPNWIALRNEEEATR
jgi:hypothetical protein